MTVRLTLTGELYTEVDAYVVGDWAVHLVKYDEDTSFYRITHIPSGCYMPEAMIGYLDLHDAVRVAQRFAADCNAYPRVPTKNAGSEFRHIFEAIAAEVTA